MDAIIYLKQQHNEFRQTLATINKLEDIKAKKNKFAEFCKELMRHELMEEKIWYPVLRKHSELKDIIEHLISEEKSAAKAIEKFKKVDFDFMWKLRFIKLKHDVNHHAKEEETELFPKVRKLFNKTELNNLGIKMREFKGKLK